MAKPKTNEVSQETLDFLEAEKARKETLQASSAKMKQLAINTDLVDKDGKDITPSSFYIRDEGIYSRTCTIRPLRYYSKFIKQVQQAGQWKIDNQSIFVENPFRQHAYDARGGIACGRLVGKAPSNWTEVQKTENYKKAIWYGFAFGIVTIPGGTPTLINFRIPQSKTRTFTDALALLDGKDMYKYNFEMKLSPVAGSNFPKLEVTPVLATELDVSDIVPYIKEVDSFVKSANDAVMASRSRLEANLKANTAYKDVGGTLADDFNDEIPFGGAE